MKRKLLSLVLALMLAFSVFTGASAAWLEGLFGFGSGGDVIVDGDIAMADDWLVEYGYDYYSTDEVALYLHAFAELPPNFITKDEAYDLGWSSSKGNLWDVAYGLCIGGDVFGNREGLLPEARGRTYYECDVNYNGGYRDAERIVFSDDGLIYYTGDHYESFDLLYEGFYYEDMYYVPYAEEASGW